MPGQDMRAARGASRDALRVVRFVWSHPANRSRRLRALVKAARFQARGRVLGKPTLVTIGERSRMWAELNRRESSTVAYANLPYWKPMQAWRALLRPGDLFIDVGAYVGVYTLWAAELGAAVIAVEPDSNNRRRLEANIALNAYDVTVLGVALARRPGTMRFVPGRDNLSQLLFDHSVGPGVATCEVPVDTLDGVIGNRYVAGVKINAGGSEHLVLEGARRALGERRIGVVQLAHWGAVELLGEDGTSVAELLASFGYQLHRPNDDGVLLPATQRPTFDTAVFARAERNSERAG